MHADVVMVTTTPGAGDIDWVVVFVHGGNEWFPRASGSDMAGSANKTAIVTSSVAMVFVVIRNRLALRE